MQGHGEAVLGHDGPFLPTASPSTPRRGLWRVRQCIHHARPMTIDDALPSAAELFGENHFGEVLAGDPAAPAQPRPWFLGDAPAPEEEPSDAAGRIAMRAEAARLPFLRVVRELLDFIGEGCRTTKLGALYAVDRRRIEEACRDHCDAWSWRPYGTDSRVQRAWDVLTEQGWLSREDGWVRPTGTPLFGPRGDALAEEGVDGARRLLAAVLEVACLAYRRAPTTEGAEDDIWIALLVASGPDGLVLPDHPHDGTLLHCFESVDFLVGLVRHPYVRDVPLDRSTGHVADSAVRRLSATARTLDLLVTTGVVTVGSDEVVEHRDEYWYEDDAPGRGPARTYRTPALLRGALALVRGRRDL